MPDVRAVTESRRHVVVDLDRLRLGVAEAAGAAG